MLKSAMMLLLVVFGCKHADIYDITITFSIIINEKSDEETDLFEYEEEGRRHIVFVIIQIRDEW